MGVGRYICVALPFVLTVASIICMLIAGLTGVVNNSLYLFRVDLTDMSINVAEISNIVQAATDAQGIAGRSPQDSSTIDEWKQKAASGEATADDLKNAAAGGGPNITAATLGLANTYDVSIWGYCATFQDGHTNCTKGEFDWASKHLNTDIVSRFTSAADVNITIPDEIQSGLDAYKAVNKWTEIVYIIAMVALGLELAVGLFTACSRAVSCLTWVIAVIGLVFVVGAAAMMTATAAVIVGTVKGSASHYSIDAGFNNNFLAVVWIGAAFAIGASLFWLFSICCCKPEKRPYGKRSKHGDDTEKMLPTGQYQPIGDHQQNRQSGYNYGYLQRGGARSDLAYEPYSHAR